MNDFLHFLNTTSVDSLTKTPGISTTLAESLVAARPFDSVEDCLKVRGMGRTLLARLQDSHQKEAVPPAEPAPAPMEQAIVPAGHVETPLEVQPETQAPQAEAQPAKTESSPSFSLRMGAAFRWFVRALARLVLIVLVIGGIGAAIYYGAPFLRETFVAPVEQNAARVTELENEAASLRTQLDEITAQLAEVNSRLDQVNAGFDTQLQDANTRIEVLEASVQAHTASLKKLEEMDAALESKIQQTNDQTLLALKNEIALTRVLDLLARARLYLAQSNFGLARADAQTARELLADLQATAADEAQAQAVERLDLALGNLPGFPVVASGDLEIAWQILMTGQALPTATPQATFTPTAAPTPTPTPGATATP